MSSTEKDKPFTLAIHGGAGVWRDELTSERERDCRTAMETALAAGEAVLRGDGTCIDAVEAAVRVLEDCPLFNAGRGSVLTSEGTVELDAALMEGVQRRAGAVCAVKRLRNPISAARAVMERSPHVLMAGVGAEEFMKSIGETLVSPRYFVTAERTRHLRRVQAAEQARMDAGGEPSANDMIGTVGAVALDRHGNLAAATSTGGMVNKRYGRVGDSPLLGCGTYADNRTCAVSATGHGEFFIRAVAAYQVSALMAHKGMSVQEAATAVLQDVAGLGGTGGMIAIDRMGNVAMPFNTEGMFRGVVKGAGKPDIAVFP